MNTKQHSAGDYKGKSRVPNDADLGTAAALIDAGHRALTQARHLNQKGAPEQAAIDATANWLRSMARRVLEAAR